MTSRRYGGTFMKLLHRIIGLLALATLAVLLHSGAASAQATRTWVSGVGDDVNPCSRTAPCKTFAGAISKTASGGEISVLDPGGFGTITITKPISIVAVGDLGSILSAGTNGINIPANFPADGKVFIKGIEIDGAGTGLNGVQILGPARVFLEDVVIRNVMQNGVIVNGATGKPRVFLNRVTITNATQNGISVLGSVANQAFIVDSVFDGNGVAVNVGSSGVVVLSGSTLTGSTGTNLTVAAGGAATSYGNNLIRTGAPTATAPLQ